MQYLEVIKIIKSIRIYTFWCIFFLTSTLIVAQNKNTVSFGFKNKQIDENLNAQLFEFNKIIKSSFEEVPKSFFENGNIVNAHFDVKNQFIVIDRYKGNIPEKKYFERTDYIKAASNYEFKGFCTSNNQLIVLFFDKLLLYDNTGGKYQLVDSINTKFDRLHSVNGNYFVLSNYYNHMDNLVKDIEFNAYKIENNHLIKVWDYSEKYDYIYYSHLVGNFLDINSKNEFLVSYPKSNHIMIIDQDGTKRKFYGVITGKIDTIHERENIKLFNKNELTIKQKIYNLKKNDTVGLRIQSIRFISDNKVLISKTNSIMKSDFVTIDMWQRNDMDSFCVIDQNTEHRIGFQQEIENKNFKILLPLSNSSIFYLNQNNLYFWDVYLPKKVTYTKSLNSAQRKLSKYYGKRKIIYGLYCFKIL